MCPKFQVYKDTADKIHFRLRADNNQTVAVGEAHVEHEGCIKCITSMLNNRNAPIEDLTAGGSDKVPNPKFEIYTDAGGKFRFRLRAANGEVIASGEACESKSVCLENIDVVRCCYAAVIEDPFVTELVIESEIPINPPITIRAVPKAADVVFRFDDQEPQQKQAPLPVFSLLTVLGLEFAMGLTEGAIGAVSSS